MDGAGLCQSPQVASQVRPYMQTQQMLVHSTQRGETHTAASACMSLSGAQHLQTLCDEQAKDGKDAQGQNLVGQVLGGPSVPLTL